jgi:hypothetical protein
MCQECLKNKEILFRYCTLFSCDVVLISGSLGTSNIRISNLDFGRARIGILKRFGITTWAGQRTQQFAGLTLRVSRQSEKAQTVHGCPSLETKCKYSLLIHLLVFLS